MRVKISVFSVNESSDHLRRVGEFIVLVTNKFIITIPYKSYFCKILKKPLPDCSRSGLKFIWWAHLGLNQGPIGYEPTALTTEL